MASLMLINPKKRSKKPRTAAQKAATRKLVALNRGKGKPSRAKKRSTATTVTVRRSNPIGLARVHHKRRVARRHNPLSIKGVTGSVMPMAMASLQGAAGAIAVNTALNYMPFLPASLNSGNGKYLARVVAAVALGAVGSKVLPRGVAEKMAIGAMTVAMHDLMLGIAATAMPTARLGDVGDYDTGVSAYVPMAAYDQQMNGVDVYAQE
jgi:hypothetical protein